MAEVKDAMPGRDSMLEDDGEIERDGTFWGRSDLEWVDPGRCDNPGE